MQEIAAALGVAQQTVSNDLVGLPTTGKPPPRPKGGCPKGAPRSACEIKIPMGVLRSPPCGIFARSPGQDRRRCPRTAKPGPSNAFGGSKIVEASARNLSLHLLSRFNAKSQRE